MKRIREQFNNAKLLASKMLNALVSSDEDVLNDLEKSEEISHINKDILNPGKFQAWQKQRNAIDVQSQWQVFLKNMEERSTETKVFNLRKYYISSAAAAVLLILFIAYNSISRKQKAVLQPVSEISVASGTSEAELVLSTGKVVSLGDAVEENLSEGTVSISNKKGVLAYGKDKEELTPKLEYNTLRIPRGGEYQLVLADSTKVWLNSDSQLRYPVSFTGNERRVYLIGEAYFEVSKDKTKPFIVVSQDQEVKVLGTEFDISAYPEDGVLLTTLAEGSVKVVVNPGLKTQKERELQPEEQLVVNTVTGKIAKKKVESFIYTSWKNGRFVFVNEPLESFFTKLARWYNVKVVIKDEALKSISFTGDLPRYKEMSTLLKVIQTETSVQIGMDKDRIIYVSK